MPRGYSKEAREKAALARAVRANLGEEAYLEFKRTGNYDQAKLAWIRTKRKPVPYPEPLNPKDSIKDPKTLREHVKRITNAIGVDPFDIDWHRLKEHAEACARPAESRFWFKSPCWANIKIDYSVHRVLPEMLREGHPDWADHLADTSPRWGHFVDARLVAEWEKMARLSAQARKVPGKPIATTAQLLGPADLLALTGVEEDTAAGR